MPERHKNKHEQKTGIFGDVCLTTSIQGRCVFGSLSNIHEVFLMKMVSGLWRLIIFVKNSFKDV